MNRCGSRVSIAGASCLLLVLNSPGLAASRDCNRNGVEDDLDIAGNTSRDCNRNDVPDECDIEPENLRFAAPIESAFPEEYGTLFSALLDDFDSDGNLDIVSLEIDKALFFPGDGQGGFDAPRAQVVAQALNISSASADLNGDGFRDVIGSGSLVGGGSGLFVLEGKGDGSFQEPINIRRASQLVFAIAIADLDLDGAGDIVVADNGVSPINVFWNEGARVFGEGSAVSSPFNPGIPAVGDIDGDGDPDILIPELATEFAVFLRNDRERRFTTVEPIRIGERVMAIHPADLDRDGDLDLVLRATSRDTISVLLNQGGTFSEEARYGMEGETIRIVPADADGDGFLDLLTWRATADCGIAVHDLSVLLNRADGTFGKHRDLRIPEPRGLVAGDVNRDGFIDAVVLRSEPNNTSPIVTVIPGGRGPAAEDADADGIPDSCALEGNDCNWNGVRDDRDIAASTSKDCNADAVPDECEPDCNGNGTPDGCDIRDGAIDVDLDGLPDECESLDGEDCNGNGRIDSIDVAIGASGDCNVNGLPDECEISPSIQFETKLAFRLELGGPSGALVSADFDRDGDADLAIAGRAQCCGDVVQPGSIAILRNGEQGRLAPLGRHSADGDPRALAALDFDGDGDVDLVAAERSVACRGGPIAALLENDGRGGLGRSGSFLLRADPSAMAAADLDRDGDIDLAFANDVAFDPAVSIYVNDGRGVFTFAADVGPIGPGTAILTGDWDADGNLDIAVASRGLWILENDGGLSFTATKRSDTEGIASLVGANLDADGDLDIVAGALGDFAGTPPRVIPFLNDGQSSFTPSEIYIVIAQPRVLLVDDWNGDGFLDALATGGAYNQFTNGIPGAVSLLHGNGDGKLSHGEFFLIASEPAAGVSNDVDGDGRLDLIVADERFGRLSVFVQEGGALGSPLQFDVGFGARKVLASDLDGDGDQDLAVISEANGNVSVFKNAGQLLEFTVKTFSDGVPPGPRDMAAADFDGDSDVDLAMAGIFRIGILRNGGDGAFTRASSLAAGSNPVALVTGDMDRDGHPDLVTANSLGSGFRDNVTIYRNEGTGTFEPGRNFVVGLTATSLSLPDIDGDGLLDIATSNAGSATFTVLRNSGGISFAPAMDVFTGVSATLIRSGDLDGDGDPDILLSDQSSIFYYRNMRQEGLLKNPPLALGMFHAAVEMADLDGDGYLDLVVSGPGNINFYRNRGGASFADPTTFDLSGTLSIPIPGQGQGGSGDPQPSIAASIAASDLDGDGDLDLALAMFDSGRLVLLTNKTPRARPDVNQNMIPDECDTPTDTVFRRADAKVDGVVDITDAIVILQQLFIGAEPLACDKAADVDDNARVDITDAVLILRILFLGTADPAAPFPGCGSDPTADLLECDSYPSC